jgi:hypothetical protein
MISISDFQDFAVFFAPEEGALIHQHILNDLAQIKAEGATLYSSQYSFSELDVAEAMNGIWLATTTGVGIFDGSCYKQSRADSAAVNAATAGLDPSRWAVGSMLNNMIVHNKTYASPELGLVFTGSFNITKSAETEANNAVFATSMSWAAAIAAECEKNLPIVKAHPYKGTNFAILRAVSLAYFPVL